jgi:hypothetical protein
VFVLFNRAPYSIIARKSRGVRALTDLEGKTLGVAEGDLSIRLWPAVAKLNGINIKSVKQSSISAAVREPMLSAGQIDAVTGFSYLSAINLQGPRRAGRRSGGAEIRRLWLRGLWLRGDRQSGAGGRQARGGEGIRAGRDRRPESDSQGPLQAPRPKSPIAWTAAQRTSNSNACKPSCATTS